MHRFRDMTPKNVETQCWIAKTVWLWQRIPGRRARNNKTPMTKTVQTIALNDQLPLTGRPQCWRPATSAIGVQLSIRYIGDIPWRHRYISTASYALDVKCCQMIDCTCNLQHVFNMLKHLQIIWKNVSEPSTYHGYAVDVKCFILHVRRSNMWNETKIKHWTETTLKCLDLFPSCFRPFLWWLFQSFVSHVRGAETKLK